MPDALANLEKGDSMANITGTVPIKADRIIFTDGSEIENITAATVNGFCFVTTEADPETMTAYNVNTIDRIENIREMKIGQRIATINY